MATSRTSSINALYADLKRKKFEKEYTDYIVRQIYPQLEEYAKKDSYKDMTLDEMYSEIMLRVKSDNARSVQAFMGLLNDVLEQPTDKTWGEYTYQEILDMYEQGATNIPDEILQWAKAMANADNLSYEVDEGGSSDDTLLTDFETDMSDKRTGEHKQVFKKYIQKADAQKRYTDEENKQLETDNTDLENKKNDFEELQKETSKKIENQVNELKELENKISRGEELSANEAIKYKNLTAAIANEQKTIKNETKNFESEIESLLTSIDEKNKVIETGEQFAQKMMMQGENYAKDEAKSNSGELPNVAGYSSTFASLGKGDALAGDLFEDAIKLSRDIKSNSSEVKHNLLKSFDMEFEIANTIFSIQNNPNTMFAKNIQKIEQENREDTSNKTDENNNTEGNNSIEEKQAAEAGIETPETETNTDNNVSEETTTEVSEAKDSTETSEGKNNTDTLNTDELINGVTGEAIGEPAEDINNFSTPAPALTLSDIFRSGLGYNMAGLGYIPNNFAGINELLNGRTRQNSLFNYISERYGQKAKTNNETNEKQEIENKKANETVDKDKTELNAKENEASTIKSNANTESQTTDNKTSKEQHNSNQEITNLNNYNSELKSIETETNDLQTRANELNSEADELSATDSEEVSSNKLDKMQDIKDEMQEVETNIEADKDEITELQNTSQAEHKEIANKAAKTEQDISYDTRDNNTATVNQDREIIKTNATEEQYTDTKKKSEIGIPINSLGIGFGMPFQVNTGNIFERFANPVPIGNPVGLRTIGGFNNSFGLNIARANLINVGIDLTSFKARILNMLAQSEKNVQKVNSTAEEANIKNQNTENELNETSEKASTVQNTETPDINDFANEDNPPNVHQEEITPGEKNFEDISKHDSPREETPHIQRKTSDEMELSDKDIELASFETDTVQNNTEEVLDDVETEIVETRAEYLKNPQILDITENQSEEYVGEAKEENTDAITKESAKDAAQQEVKESVKEMMQSTLSSLNKKAQEKDTDKDKKHKLFTQFEREKKDALRKTVQKVSKARDAR